MANGVRANAGLLSVVAPRVSPEYVVVASAAQGLLAAIDGATFDVRLEYPHAQHPRKKCDLVVVPRGDGEPYWYEFKSLWSGGMGENVTGIRADLAKLAHVQHGVAVAFAYALSEVPAGAHYHSAEALVVVIANARQQLNREPFFVSDALDIVGNGVRGRASLVAWRASHPG